jgi:uncharacterized protein with PQ loop repeat
MDKIDFTLFPHNVLAGEGCIGTIGYLLIRYPTKFRIKRSPATNPVSMIFFFLSRMATMLFWMSMIGPLNFMETDYVDESLDHFQEKSKRERHSFSPCSTYLRPNNDSTISEYVGGGSYRGIYSDLPFAFLTRQNTPLRWGILRLFDILFACFTIQC